MTGDRTVYVDLVDPDQSVRLSVSCSLPGRTFLLSVANIDSYTGRGTVDGLLKFDEETAQQIRWYSPWQGDADFVGLTVSANVLRKMMSASRLRVRVSPPTSYPRDFSWDLKGSAKAIAPIMAACGY